MNEEDLKALLLVLNDDLGDISNNDLSSLMGIIESLAYTKGRINHLDNQWVPSPKSVLEVLTLGLPPLDLEKTISSFISFAQQRNYEQHLDSKFITHAKLQLNRN